MSKEKKILIDTAIGEMLVLELYAQLDDKEVRKKTVKQTLDTLYENEKISNTTYKEALNILED